jgi:2,3-bisphosphoglycerate-independent phosphoglycerate mutase
MLIFIGNDDNKTMMTRESLHKKLSIQNQNKLIMIVLDGLGGLPINGKTELESAKKPNLNHLATESELGLSHPVSLGITPGSGPAHLALFGYDPLKYLIGRGILEALGIGVNVKENDIAVRGNYATQNNGIITDRRAGRITTEKNQEITTFLDKRINWIEDVQISIFPGAEHRFVLLLTGSGLDDEVTDADPEETGKPILYSQAKTPQAERTAKTLNKFIIRVTEELKNQTPVNTCLLRGAAKYPNIPSMQDLFKLKAAAIATYPMYKGLAQLVGMDILETGKTLKDEIKTLKAHYESYDFFFFHIKKTDSYGEDGDFKNKVKMIEEFDESLPEILSLNPHTLVITGDHSTPSLMKSHSWHPNPILLRSPFRRAGRNKILSFSEKECSSGVLGQFYSLDILPLMMAHSLRFKKYGA